MIKQYFDIFVEFFSIKILWREYYYEDLQNGFIKKEMIERQENSLDAC